MCHLNAILIKCRSLDFSLVNAFKNLVFIIFFVLCIVYINLQYKNLCKIPQDVLYILNFLTLLTIKKSFDVAVQIS